MLLVSKAASLTPRQLWLKVLSDPELLWGLAGVSIGSRRKVGFSCPREDIGGDFVLLSFRA